MTELLYLLYLDPRYSILYLDPGYTTTVEAIMVQHLLLPKTAEKTNVTAKTYVQQRRLDRASQRQTEILLAAVLA